MVEHSPQILASEEKATTTTTTTTNREIVIVLNVHFRLKEEEELFLRPLVSFCCQETCSLQCRVKQA